MERRSTRQISVGDILVGGSSPVSVQTMTTGPTSEIDACVAEINTLADAGADIVRLAVPRRADTAALTEILPQVTVPIVADVHFHFERAIEAVEAGVQKIRLNPGNIDDCDQVQRVIDACRQSGIPIRIGVNEGSIVERRDKQQRREELAAVFANRTFGGLLALMIAKLEEYLELFDRCNFHDICLSAKSMNAMLAIEVYREVADRFDYPLHLGVTHAGPRDTGAIRSIAALGTLLAEGIGDTIRISYAGDSRDEVTDGIELLCSLGLRERSSAELIACPTCGRIQVDLVSLVEDVRAKLADDIDVPIKVAVMGCVVNGPGEAEGADVAVFAGDRRGIIYVQGERVASVPEGEILDRLLAECRSLQDRVRTGDTLLGDKAVSIIPPDPLPLRPTVEGTAASGDV